MKHMALASQSRMNSIRDKEGASRLPGYSISRFFLKSILYMLLLLCVILQSSCRNSAPVAISNSAADFSLPLKCQSIPLDIVGMAVTPHVYSKELRYWNKDKLPEETGALVRIVVTNRNPAQPINLNLLFNGKTPDELLSSGDWSWYEMPENKYGNTEPYSLGAGKTDIFTFNGKRPPWSLGNSFTLTVMDKKSGASEEHNISITPDKIEITQLSFLSKDDSHPYADNIIAHIANNTDSPLRMTNLRIYTPEADGLSASASAEKITSFSADSIIPPHDRGGANVSLGKIPLVRGLVRVDLEDGIGRLHTVWGSRYFGKQQFDIGSGWLEIATEKGIVPLTRENYLKLLKRMHVNLAHIENITGYTDSVGENGLYTRYPLRMMSSFTDISAYNSDEWVMKIHGVDLLGEAQIDKTPMQTYNALKSYMIKARYPTTITFNDDQGFRYYAGIADFPHFDAYRVNAGSVDEWIFYNRWGRFIRILWGAPLEGIGEITRTLYAMSRPAPVAVWSENVHEGWFSSFFRERANPTPDEILIQAYEALANGVKSLYWYSLQSWSLLKGRDTIDMTTRIGREIRLLEDIYLAGDAYRHKRIGSTLYPSLDLSSIISPKEALLFAIDLQYKASFKKQVFEYDGPRSISASFDLPGYLRNPRDLFRINADGIHTVQWKTTPTGVSIEDTLDRVGVYVASMEENCREKLQVRLEKLKKEEKQVGFNPGVDDNDYNELLRDFGYKDANSIGANK